MIGLTKSPFIFLELDMTRNIINLTQHKATPEQVKAGVFDLHIDRHRFTRLLTFDKIPTASVILSTVPVPLHTLQSNIAISDVQIMR